MNNIIAESIFSIAMKAEVPVHISGCDLHSRMVFMLLYNCQQDAKK